MFLRIHVEEKWSACLTSYKACKHFSQVLRRKWVLGPLERSETYLLHIRSTYLATTIWGEHQRKPRRRQEKIEKCDTREESLKKDLTLLLLNHRVVSIGMVGQPLMSSRSFLSSTRVCRDGKHCKLENDLRQHVATRATAASRQQPASKAMSRLLTT